MSTTSKFYAEYGESVSEGTLREQDLLKSFCDWLENHNPEPGEVTLISEAREYLNTDPDTWDDETIQEVSMLVNENLFDAMEHHAPWPSFFGSHPGDGSDFGFWTPAVHVRLVLPNPHITLKGHYVGFMMDNDQYNNGPVALEIDDMLDGNEITTDVFTLHPEFFHAFDDRIKEIRLTLNYDGDVHTPVHTVLKYNPGNHRYNWVIELYDDAPRDNIHPGQYERHPYPLPHTSTISQVVNEMWEYITEYHGANDI